MTKVSRIITTRPTTRAHLNRASFFRVSFISPSLFPCLPRENARPQCRVFALRRSVLSMHLARTVHLLFRATIFFRNRAPSSNSPPQPCNEEQLYVSTETTERPSSACMTKRASFRDFPISSSEGSALSRHCARAHKDDIRHVATAVKKCVGPVARTKPSV